MPVTALTNSTMQASPESAAGRFSRPLPLALTLLALIFAFHLGNAMAGRSLFRAIHLGTALHYAETPINLLEPVIVGFNANHTPTAQELPLWQATVGLLFKLTGSTWYGWANLVSFAFFLTGLWPLFQLARQYVGERAAWWSLCFFLAQPLIVIMAGQASTDGFCLVLTLWFLFFANKMIHTGQARWWWPTALFAILAAVSKLPFFMAAGFCSVFLLVLHRRWSWQPWALLAAAGTVAAISLFAWTRHADALAAQAEYPYYELRLFQNPQLAYWYFGDLQLRLRPGPWVKGAWRFIHGTMGCLPVAGLLILALLRPGNRMPKLWLLATLLTTLVFTHVVLVHWHYYLMCCPAVALLCGVTIARWETFGASELHQRWLRHALAGMVLVFAAVDGVIATKIAIYYDLYPKRMGEIIRQHTHPHDKVIVSGGDWGGEELFRAGRQGFYIYDVESGRAGPNVKGLFDLLASEPDVQRLKALGYTKLVLLSESPVRFAAVAVNPGSQRKRTHYPDTISPAVDSWPVVYQSEDILIRDIP
jgi:hypothetical protein